MKDKVDVINLESIEKTLDLELSGETRNRDVARKAYNKEDLQLAKEELDYKSKKQDIKVKKQSIKLRKIFSEKVYCFSVYWIIGVFIIVLLCGFDFIKFELPSEVLITMLSTTTIAVFGLFVLVLKYIFPNNHNTNPENTDNNSNY